MKRGAYSAIKYIGNTIYQKIVDEKESQHSERVAELEQRIRDLAAVEKDKSFSVWSSTSPILHRIR